MAAGERRRERMGMADRAMPYPNVMPSLQVGCSKQTSKTYTFFAYSFASFDNQIRGKVDISPFFDMAMPTCFQSFFEIEINSSGFISKMKT